MNYSKICLVNGTTCDSVTGSSFAPPRRKISTGMNQFAALLGVLHQAAQGQRGLVPAAGALEQLPGAVADNIVRIVVAARTAQATRPTRGLQHLGAMRLGAKAAKELRQGQAGLRQVSNQVGEWK